jgi:phage protein D
MSFPGLGTDVTPHVTPTITVGGAAIPDDMVQNLVQTVVDTHLHLPDMFEITLLDGDQSAIGLFTIGAHVEIFGGAPGDTSASSLIKGEVTAVEGDFRSPVIHTIVRGYEKAHRMQRVSHTRAFLNMKDSDIASQIAGAYNYDGTDISDSKVTHDHVAQIDQTDWDFLKYRAAELGFETGVAGGKFFFRKASGSSDGDGGGLMGAVGGALSSLTGGAAPTLTFGDDLLYFRPRVTAGDLTSDVEVRVWDPMSASVVSSSSPVQSGTATLSKAPKPGEMAGQFKEDSPLSFLALPSINIPGLKLPSLGSAPSSTARVVCDRPVETGSAASPAAEGAAKGLAEHLGSTFAEAEGFTYGNPKIQAGQAVTIAGVPDEFAGQWVVTNALHSFIPAEGGYRTDFVVSGRHDRSMLGLASVGRTNGARPVINGFVCGVVTNNNDPKNKGRVKVAFPVYSNAFESDWARVVQVGLGADWGMLFTPEVHDEVLVGFEFGDIRRPYVLGGLINGNTTNDIMSNSIKSTGMSAKVVQRGLITPTGNRIVFDDDEMTHGQPMPPPSKSAITISDKDGKLAITLDKTSGSIQISAAPIPPAVTTSTITIQQQGPGGSISIQADGNISVAAGTAGQLTLQAGLGVTIDGGLGGITLKGTPASPIQLGG